MYGARVNGFCSSKRLKQGGYVSVFIDYSAIFKIYQSSLQFLVRLGSKNIGW